MTDHPTMWVGLGLLKEKEAYQPDGTAAVRRRLLSRVRVSLLFLVCVVGVLVAILIALWAEIWFIGVSCRPPPTLDLRNPRLRTPTTRPWKPVGTSFLF